MLSKHLLLFRLFDDWVAEEVSGTGVFGFFYFLGFAFDVLSHRVFAAEEGDGIIPAVVPCPAVPGIVFREALWLPDVAAVSFEDQRAGFAFGFGCVGICEFRDTENVEELIA